MADMPTISGTRIAFSSYNPADCNGPYNDLAVLSGGILRAMACNPGNPVILPSGQTHFGYVDHAALDVVVRARDFVIPQGFYFSLDGSAVLTPRDGEPIGVIISAPAYKGFVQIGQLEWVGRLRYINGCTDSLLIPPIKLGDPCLNLLYFPANTDQTMHTHPSDRIGMILSGRGICQTEDESGTHEIPLEAGMLFCIHTGGLHKFQTFDAAMRVLAYHPDSDFGPTDEDHPMINRTMVDGVSAAKLTEIHTTK